VKTPKSAKKLLPAGALTIIIAPLVIEDTGYHSLQGTD
jgi:hypothetical protein